MSSCDMVICGARVIDGSGAASKTVDVAVERDRIVDIGDCDHWRADQTIDATGLVLTPGFIDSHTHDDQAIFDMPDLPCKLSQGVTSVIAGNCGFSLAPLNTDQPLPAPFPLLGEPDKYRFPTVRQYRDALAKSPAAVNLALLAGHSNLRLQAMPEKLGHAADSDAIRSMQQSLRLALKQGCIGLSTGLAYPPAQAASTDEVVQLASVLRDFEHAVYVTHMRDEGDHVVDAVEETIRIGSRARVPAIISHHKCTGPDNYGRSRQTLELIDEARARNQAVGLDVYPYIASSTSLLPHFIEGCEAVLVAESKPHPECNGRMLDQIAAEWQCSPEEACERLYPAAAIYFQMQEADLERIMAHPATMIGSDGIASMKMPHPRLWGTFSRVLGHYVREKRLLDLETAVHKMTGMTAKRFGFEKRGLIEVGNYADLVLFDPAKIIDRASFENPTLPSSGICSVWVNGGLAWQDGQATKNRAGRFLSH